MGFWGTFVTCRTDSALTDLRAIAMRSEGLDYQWRTKNGWQVGQYDRLELGDDAPAMLADLAAETGHPTLCAFVLDSDAIQIDGFSENGHWRACLARESMRDYCEDDDEDFDFVFLPPETAVKQAARWSDNAGYGPNLVGLRAVFSTEEAVSAAEDLFFELLEHLGPGQLR
ncbi:MAG: hypothetical protein JWQ81_2659 [Amycolatopsis sp.]|jgi:hypothetical protein|uniref:hypothetical protein n=1 Tax=Amycolatopsis sp. TaxID=37632 RepID=UPI00261F79C3|nr:hypothetical protein [Amycolatopsis sp.]MCU1681920.1 hypothetical protein [Amycolatopsis sp.]